MEKVDKCIDFLVTHGPSTDVMGVLITLIYIFLGFAFYYVIRGNKKDRIKRGPFGDNKY
jgi:hypothetical protein